MYSIPNIKSELEKSELKAQEYFPELYVSNEKETEAIYVLLNESSIIYSSVGGSIESRIQSVVAYLDGLRHGAQLMAPKIHNN